ncbi:MAG TPA: hypothetical protein VH640_14545 [Bryobacteraceae bacterium]
MTNPTVVWKLPTACGGASMKVTRKIRLAWKYRRAIWKYRRLLRYRRELGGLAVAGVVLGIAALLPHRAK